MGIFQTPQAIVPAAFSSGAGNLVQIATGTLSGASVTISSLSTYTELLLFVLDCTNSTADGHAYVQINGNTTSNYDQYGYVIQGANAPAERYLNGQDKAHLAAGYTITRTNDAQSYTIKFTNCKNAGFTDWDVNSFCGSSQNVLYSAKGIFKVNAAVSSLLIASTGGNWAGGTYTLWGA